jgi:transcriptional regulator of acetoin/glycerol metabolism
MPEDLPIYCSQHPPAPSGRSLAEVEKSHIEDILSDNQWNISKSAKILKIDRSTLYHKIKRYNLKKPE